MNKKGFTLIELLAVIIILGILMIIAIPSVTKYISDSRKNAYIDTAKEMIGSARNLVNSGSLEMYDTDATYYIESGCIKTENDSTSPYGKFTKAYVVVTYDGNGYTYYWTSVDDAGQGIKDIIRFDKLDTDNIDSDLNNDDISTLRGIDGRSKTIVVSERNNCQKEGSNDANSQINGETGEKVKEYVCKKATTLHTKTCDRSNRSGCVEIVGSGNTLTYGTIPNVTPKGGDAYDCKVTKNGGYTERFYYLTSSGENSTLIYYTNIDDQTAYAYDSTNENWHGPRTGYQHLPSITEWNNPNLIAPGASEIYNDNGGRTTHGGRNNIESFTYTDKAARFLKLDEAKIACGKDLDSTATVDISDCYWLMENVGNFERETGERIHGYYLENPHYNNTYYVRGVAGLFNIINTYNSNDTTYSGVRPVITVKTSDIEQ